MSVENIYFSYPCIKYLKNESLENKHICNMLICRYVIVSFRLSTKWIGGN